MSTAAAINFLRLPQIRALFGNVSAATPYKWSADGLLPRLLKIGPKASGLPEHEVARIQQARIAGRSDEEIRALVVKIETERTGIAATPRRAKERSTASKRRTASKSTEQRPAA